MTAATSQMSGWTQNQRGSPSDVLSLSTSLPVPAPKLSTDVLVRVSHAALNPGGAIMVTLCPFWFRTKPSIPELDFAGTVAALGAQVEGDEQAHGPNLLKEGDSVFGSIDAGQNIRFGVGSLAKYVVVPRANLAKSPRGNGDMAEQAAGLGVAGCTALDLLDATDLKTGNSVLVYGASGGIGSMVLQMVRDVVGKNGRVVAVCSARNTQKVKSLGADEVMDYGKFSSIAQELASRFSSQRFDCVIDAYGIYGLYSGCAGFLAQGKPFVTVGVANKQYSYGSMLKAVVCMLANVIASLVPGAQQRKYIQVASTTSQKGLERLRVMVEEGRLKVPIDSSWSMVDTLKAYERMLSKHASGKVIVEVGKQ